MNNNYQFISVPYSIDRKLYKYFSNVGHAVDCIKKRSIHLDDPKTFNDPFDATFSCPRYTALDYEENVKKLLTIYLTMYLMYLQGSKLLIHAK